MKAFITICSIVAALYLAWQRHDLNEAKVAAEAKAEEAKSTLDRTKAQLESANMRIAELTAIRPAAPTPKANWVEERNRNWNSALGKGSYDNRPAVSPPVIYSPGQTTYYSDFKGRYWIDSNGVKHYAQ